MPMKAAKFIVALAGMGLGLALMLDASDQVDLVRDRIDTGILWGIGATLAFGATFMLGRNQP